MHYNIFIMLCIIPLYNRNQESRKELVEKLLLNMMGNLVHLILIVTIVVKINLKLITASKILLLHKALIRFLRTSIQSQ